MVKEYTESVEVGNHYETNSHSIYYSKWLWKLQSMFMRICRYDLTFFHNVMNFWPFHDTSIIMDMLKFRKRMPSLMYHIQTTTTERHTGMFLWFWHAQPVFI